MKLLNCHVENFGKLSDFDYDFNENINMVFANNGWGKSTFAAFLKVMFYGFDGEKARVADRERKRYQPWQGGVYGGSLTFAQGAKTYTITRSFNASKAAEDTFEIRDAETNLVSKDFTDKIGEELFSIDSESFKKSIFIHQGNCGSGATDGINAKMGNLSDTTDDISRFEAADKALNDYLNSHSPSRATGSLNREKLAIEGLKQDIRTKESLEESVAADSTTIKELEKRKKDYELQKEKLSKKQAEVSEYKDIQTKKSSYDALVEDVAKRQAAYDEAKTSFPKGAPLKAQAEEAFALAEEYEASLSKLEGLKFAEGDRQQYGELKLRFADGMPSVETIKDVQKEWGTRSTRVTRIESLKERIGTLEDVLAEKAEEPGSRNTGLIALGIVVLILGAVAFFLGNSGVIASNYGIYGAVVAMVGAVLAVVGMMTKGGKTKAAETPTLGKIEAYNEEIKTLTDEIEKLDSKTKDFLAKYNIDFNEPMVNQALFDLQSQVSSYDRIKENAEKFDECAAICSKQKSKLEDIAFTWGLTVGDRVSPAFKEARKDYEEYMRADLELMRANDALMNFEKKNGGKEALMALGTKAAPEEDSVVKLNDDINYINESLEEIAGKLRDIKGRMSRNMETLDDLKEKESMLDDRSLQFEKDKDKYKNVKLTKELLEEAHNAFLLKYSAPLKESFDKYYGLVTAEKDDIYIDVKSNVTKMEQGAQRDIAYLSSGYQDLIGVCLRFAFVDAMYPDEKPFVILDDPFSNLDGEKTAKVQELLKEVSKKYQVIYFTCHEALTV